MSKVLGVGGVRMSLSPMGCIHGLVQFQSSSIGSSIDCGSSVVVEFKYWFQGNYSNILHT